MTVHNRIDRTFESLRQQGRMGLFPYLTAGFPTLEATEQLLLAAVEAGADGLELGIPFSDPLADGATMQYASEVALGNGSSLSWSLALLRRLRAHIDVPIVPMTYYNPVHRYGLDRFVDDVVDAGGDGVIVPDLPFSEAGALQAAADRAGLHIIQFAAPTSTDERLAEVGRTASGFVYCVSLVGTTGTRQQVSDQLPAFMARVRSHVQQPLMIGFGIARPEHVVAVRPHADAVIVGSALVDLIKNTAPDQWHNALTEALRNLRTACETPVTVPTPRGRG
jgi:tryptophan synthase alpha chain